MEVTITGNLIEIVKDDGTEMVINGLNIVDEGAIRWEQYNTTPPASSGNPYLTPIPAKVTRYKVTLHFNDNRWEEIALGDVINQPSWTDDLTGANTAVADLSAALVVSGGGGGGGVTSVSASSPLSSSGGTTPTISHQTSGVTAAPYTVNGQALFTVNTTGHVTSASNATIASEPAGSNFEIQFNDDGDMGASPDLLFDGVLQVGADSNIGQIQLGGVDGTASGSVSSNGTLNVEGQDINVSAGDTATLSGTVSARIATAGVERLAFDSDGAMLVGGSAGTDGQFLRSNGSGVPAEWDDINTDQVTDNSTIGGGAQNLTDTLDAIADVINNWPAPPVTSVNGDTGNVVLTASDIDITEFISVTISGVFTGEPFRLIATGRYQRVSNTDWEVRNDIGGVSNWVCGPSSATNPGTRYLSNVDDASPVSSIESWTTPSSSVVPGTVAQYSGPTVQDALEQLAVPTQPQYKVWEGYMTQSGTDAPTVVEITNTLGGTPALSYVTDGRYEAELTGAFPQGVSFYSGPAAIDGASMITNAYFVSIVPVGNDNVMRIYSGSVRTGDLIDGILAAAYFKITVKVP